MNKRVSAKDTVVTENDRSGILATLFDVEPVLAREGGTSERSWKLLNAWESRNDRINATLTMTA